MTKYAIIQLAGKQYQVSEGETLIVDKIDAAQRQNDTVTVSEVLLVNTGADIKVGTPFVPGASVALKVVSDQKGEKIRVFKFKSKSRYRRAQGHRQQETLLSVDSISA